MGRTLCILRASSWHHSILVASAAAVVVVIVVAVVVFEEGREGNASAFLEDGEDIIIAGVSEVDFL